MKNIHCEFQTGEKSCFRQTMEVLVRSKLNNEFGEESEREREREREREEMEK